MGHAHNQLGADPRTTLTKDTSSPARSSGPKPTQISLGWGCGPTRNPHCLAGLNRDLDRKGRQGLPCLLAPETRRPCVRRRCDRRHRHPSRLRSPREAPAVKRKASHWSRYGARSCGASSVMVVTLTCSDGTPATRASSSAYSASASRTSSKISRSSLPCSHARS